MNSEKIIEIKKALQDHSIEKLKYQDGIKIKEIDFIDILTLINELESENEKLQRDCVITAYDKLRAENKKLKDRLGELKEKIENGTLVELGYHIRKSYRNHDDQRYKIILIDEVEIDKIGYDGLTKAEAEKKLKELQEKQQ